MRLGLKESKVWSMKTGFSDLEPSRRQRAERCDKNRVIREAMKADCLSWFLHSRPAFVCGRKNWEKMRLEMMRAQPSPILP